jgi:hypothetical protein
MAKRTFRVVRKNRKSRRRIKGGSPESDNLNVLLLTLLDKDTKINDKLQYHDDILNNI